MLIHRGKVIKHKASIFWTLVYTQIYCCLVLCSLDVLKRLYLACLFGLLYIHRKTQVNHLTHLSHSGSVHGQNDSKMCEK